MPKTVFSYLILFNGIDQWFGLHATATVMQGGQKGLLFRLEKKSIAETLVFLKVPTTGAGWQSRRLGSPGGSGPPLRSGS